MKIKVGDKFKCIKTMKNVFGWTLFAEGNIYEVLDVDYGYITLNHILYGNEYADFSFDEIKDYLVNIKELRRNKIKKIENL